MKLRALSLSIDDRSAKSPILKKILLGAAPSGVKVLVWNVAEAAENGRRTNFQKQSADSV